MEKSESTEVENLYLWIMDRFKKARVTIHAGHVTFFILLSFFPFMMLFISVLKSTDIIDLNRIRESVNSVDMGFIGKTITGWMDDIVSTQGGLISAASIIVLIWSGSKGFDGLARGLDRIYNAHMERSYVRRRLLSMMHLISFVLMIVFSLVLVVFGDLLIRKLSEELSWMKGMGFLATMIRYLAIAVIFLTYFVMMYRFIPYTPTETREEFKERRAGNKGIPRKERTKRPIQRTIRRELPGAFLTSFVWTVFSRLYGIYMSYQVEHNTIYGSLTAFFLTLLWLYYCVVLIFLGGIFNCYYYENGESAFRHIFKDIPGLVRFLLAKLPGQKKKQK